MLDTLIQIGALESTGQDEWDKLIFKPPTDKKSDKKDAKSIQYYIYFLIFDLDEMSLKLEPMAQYDDEKAKTYRNLNVKGGNNMAYYVTAHFPKHFEQLCKTLFGKTPKEGEKIPTQGELLDLICKEMPELNDGILAKVLAKVFELKQDFYQLLPDGDKSPALKITTFEKIHLIVSAVKWQEQGIEKVTPLAQLDGYELFILNKLLPKIEKDANNPLLKLCYASGELADDVAQINISNRYSLNKMFVETTKNYASDFDKNKFGDNYQVSLQKQALLEAGSKKILNDYTCKMAGIDHCILRKLSIHTPSDRALTLLQIDRSVDFLFSRYAFDNLNQWIDKNTRNTSLFWLTFMAYESDGNFFKTINLIQDVNAQYFNQIIDVFADLNMLFLGMDGIQWATILTQGKDKTMFAFNFLAIYNMIPVRKDKEKKNVALSLLKAIWEQRPIEQSVVFQHFKELILCHRFERYAGYTNIFSNDNFDFAARNAAFQYLALLEILKKLNLLKNMDVTTTPSSAFPNDSYGKILQFCETMGYNQNQTALFLLGRVLCNIADAQVVAEHKNKPILNKLNYNGMDLDEIAKLLIALSEKTQQYSPRKDLPWLRGTNEKLMGYFTDFFQPIDWKVGREEALMYLLLGYSFRPKVKTKEVDTNNNTEQV